MATQPPPVAQIASLTPPQPSTSPALKSEIMVSEPRDGEPLRGPVFANSDSPEPSSSAASPAAASYTITIPRCSGWFCWDQIHEAEWKLLPEFFDGRSSSRNHGVYKYYRNAIVRRFRANPSRKITFTDARRGLIGDVGSIRRVFDFLEEWGLINYAPSSAKPVYKEKREPSDEGADRKDGPRKICFNCKAPCSLCCFATEKADIILCSRCFVHRKYRPGLNFQRIDLNEETKTEWTDKETLHLLEAILQYGEDWKKVADHVGGRTEKECVAKFINLPFGEQFLGPSEVGEDGRQHQKEDNIYTPPQGDCVAKQPFPKRRCLTPLADASNPIMAQVAFLSAMVGSNVAKSAAQAAILALDKFDSTCVNVASGKTGSALNEASKEEASTANVSPDPVLNEAAEDARSQLEKEENDVELYLSDILEVQMKEIHDKIQRFEEVELLVEKEKLQVQYMRDLLVGDQLALLQHEMRCMSKAI